MKVSTPFGCIWSLCNSKIGLDRRIDQYLINRQEKQDLFKILNLDSLYENLTNIICLSICDAWTNHHFELTYVPSPTQNCVKN